MKKVLFFINAFSGGGAEKVCLNMAEQLYKSGYECHFITLYKENGDYKVPSYIKEYCVEVDRNASIGKRLYQIGKSVIHVNRYLKENSFELITAHLPMAHILAALSTVGKSALYVMHHAQWPLNKNNSKWYKIRIYLFYKNKKIVTVSNGIRDELVSEYGIKQGHVFRIYNPVPVKDIITTQQNTKVYEKPYVISVGRLAYPKRPDITIDLYAKSNLKEKYDLVFLGQGEYLTYLKEKVEKYKLETKVFFAGFQKNPYEWIKGAELMLSVSDSEAMPMNIIEALACETKVIAANCKYGPDEILIGELAKYLINPKTEFDKSVEVLNSAMEEYPENLYSYVEKFEVNTIIHSYLELYKELFER